MMTTAQIGKNMAKRTLEIGQKIIFQKLYNLRGATLKESLVEGTITSIGKKYFTVESIDYYILSSKFEIETLQQHNVNFSSQYQGYLSMQEVLDNDEVEKGISRMKKFFEYGVPRSTINVDQIRAILSILNLTNE